MKNSNIVEFIEYCSPDGVTYRFSTEDRSYNNFTGTGIGSTVNFVSDSLKNGIDIISTTFNEKVISFDISINGCTRQDFWDNRENLTSLTNPVRGNYYDCNCGLLKIYLPNGDYREIDVLLSSGLDFETVQDDQWNEWCLTASLKFTTCGEPYFRGKEICKIIKPNEYFNAYSSICADPCILSWEEGDCFPVKCTEEVMIDGLLVEAMCFETNNCVPDCTNMDQGESCVYCGNIASPLSIEIIGPGYFPTISHEKHGAFQLCYNIPEGDSVLFEIGRQNNSITNSAGDNLLYLLSNVEDSLNISNFNMLADGDVVGGKNNFFFSMVAVDFSTCIKIKYNELFVGL